MSRASITPSKLRAPAAHGRPTGQTVRIALEQLETRETPALFTVGTPQTSTQLNNNGFVAAGDWDGNGTLDLVLANYGDGTAAGSGKTITFAYGNGNGGFGSYQSKPVSNGGSDAVAFIAVGDLTNDGIADIVTANTNMVNENGTISVFIGNAAGGFDVTAASPIGSAGSRAAWVGIADFDKDGNRDVAVVNLGEQTGGTGRSVAIFKGNGTGALTQFQKLDVAVADGVATAGAIADFNNDTFPDLAVTFATVPPEGITQQQPGSVRTFMNKMDGTVQDFSQAAVYESGGPLPISIAAGDFSGDGKIDLVVANAGDPDVNSTPIPYAQFGFESAVGTLTNGGTGSFGPTTKYTTIIRSAFAVALADMNLDGRPDIVVADIGKPPEILGTTPGGVVVFLKNPSGAGFLTEPTGPHVSPSTGPQYLAVGSFTSNTDTSPDVVLVHSSSRIVTFSNTTVPAQSTTTTITAPANPTTSPFGQAITFTATVTAGTGTPTGTVTFLNGTTAIGTGTLSGGTASFTTSTPINAGGPYTITARYEGTTGFLASTSPAISLTVTPAATTTTASGPTGPVTQGQPAALTATVTSAAGTPTGTVNFLEGTTVVATGTLSGGTLTVNTTTLSAGTHTLFARYVGTANFATSDSATFTVQIDPPAPVSTTTTLNSNNPNTQFNQSVTFTATVSPAPSGGTVSFRDNGVEFGTATVNGSGVATFTTSSLSVGAHPITAVYLGTTGFLTSTSNTVTQNVAAATTTTTAFGPGSPVTEGQPVSLTANVTSAAGTPTGTVNFLEGTTVVATGTLSGGTLTVNTTTLSAGTHTLFARYVGTTNFAASDSATFTVQINPAPIGTSTSLSSSSPTSQFGQSVTFTAVVSAASGPAPGAGSVSFRDNGVQIGTAPVDASGVATFTTSSLSVGAHPITAVYLGTATFLTSTSNTITQTVGAAATTTTAFGPGSPVTEGQPVSLTANVTSAGGTPVGAVAFMVGTTVVASGTLSGGTLTLNTSTLSVGTHTLFARYAGTTNFAASDSATFTVTINPAPVGTTTTVSSSDPNTQLGESVTFTATVTAASGPAPTAGTVSFRDNGVQIGTGTVGAGGIATFTTTGLSVGSHPITAVYLGSGVFVTSTSNAVTQTVAPASTTVTAFGPGGPVTAGQPVTLTANVASAAGTPTGFVTFLEGGVPVAAGALTGGTLTVNTTALSVGTHTLFARYDGSTNFAAGDSPAFTVTVSPIGTITSLGASSTSAVAGQPLTFTATVTAPPGPAPGVGSVRFLDNGVEIGQVAVNGSGVATFTTSTLPVAMHVITAEYVATGPFGASNSNPVTLFVTPPAALDTTTTLATGGTPALLGQPVTFTATVGAASGVPTGTVIFRVDGVQAGTAPLTGGVATFTTSAIGIGAHAVTAEYAGTAAFNPSASNVVTQTIQVGTTIDLQTTALQAAFGQPVTITATVGATGAVPLGTVTFRDGGTVLATVGLSAANGQQQAALTTSALGIGSHQISAEYTPVAGFLPSTASFTQVVTAIPTTIGLTVSPIVLDEGGTVTITADLNFPAGALAPTGTVRFLSDGALIGTAAAGDAPVTVTTTTLPTGVNTITAVYDGDASFAASTSGGLDVTVNGVSPPPPPPPPQPTASNFTVAGASNGSARQFNAGTRQPVGNPISPFPGFNGDVRGATGDFNGDGVLDTAMVTGPGIKTVMAVVSGADGSILVPPTDPFGDANFTFGGFVTAGDIDGDGRAEWVVTPELRGGPRVIIFRLLPDGRFDLTSPGQPSLVANFFGIGDPAFRDGDRAALGDVNGDGVLDVFSIAAFNGGPRTALYNGADVLTHRSAGRDPIKLTGDFFAAPSGADEGRGGRSIAVGDVDGDGLADLIATGDNLLGTGNQVVIFSGADLLAGRFPGFGATPLANFSVSGMSSSALVSVAAVNSDGDARADLAVGSGGGQGSLVKIYQGTSLSGAAEPASTQFDPFGTVTLSGVFVG